MCADGYNIIIVHMMEACALLNIIIIIISPLCPYVCVYNSCNARLPAKNEFFGCGKKSNRAHPKHTHTHTHYTAPPRKPAKIAPIEFSRSYLFHCGSCSRGALALLLL